VVARAKRPDPMEITPDPAERAAGVRRAIASARIEGLAPSAGALSLLNDYAEGRISAEEMIELGAKLDDRG